MIYVTGDTHGDLKAFQERALQKLKKGDVLFICGDFGFIWDGSKEEQKALRWLSGRKYTIAFVEGAYDNVSLLEQYPEESLWGGTVRRIGKNLVALGRGEVYRVGGKTVFTCGGGERSEEWFMRDPEEAVAALPSREELERVVASAQRAGHLDLVLTHDAPATLKLFVNMENSYINDLHEQLDVIYKTVPFELWLFGCYHLDRFYSSKYGAVYQELVPVGERSGSKR